MTYHDSLWKDAPAGTTHCGVYRGFFCWLKIQDDGKFVTWHPVRGWGFYRTGEEFFEPFYECPVHWKSCAQLVDQYRKEHGIKIDADCEAFMAIVGRAVPLDHLLDDAAFHLALLERYLAAERARVEGAK